MNTHSKKWLVSMAIGLSVLTAGCGPREGQGTGATEPGGDAAPTLKFQALNVGSEVLGDQSVPARSIFRPDDKLFASVQTTTAGRDVPVSVRLVAMANGQSVADARRTVSATGPATTNFEFKSPAPWPIGRYQVEVDIGGRVHARQEIDIRADGPPRPNGNGDGGKDISAPASP